MLLSSMEGVVAGAAGGGLLGALVGWGVSKQHILKYEEHLKSGKYLLMALTQHIAILRSYQHAGLYQHVPLHAAADRSPSLRR
jgi:uncharacterized membrane protein